MKKTGLTILVTTSLILTACGSSAAANCPEGFVCTPLTATPNLSEPLSTPIPISSPVIEPTQMLESIAAFGVPISFACQLMGWEEYKFDYIKAGWDESNPDCLITADGRLVASGNGSCKIFPHPGLQLAAEVTELERVMIGATLGMYGGYEISSTPSTTDTNKKIVILGFE